MDTCPTHTDTRPRRRGSYTKKNGTVMFRFWCPDDGGHSLTEPDPMTVPRKKRVKGKRDATMRCPNGHHADAKVVKNGKQKDKSGAVWQRWLCVRPDGTTHSFQTLNGVGGAVRTTYTPPPECPEHPGSYVVRDGLHKRAANKVKTPSSTRQRYLCRPVDGEPSHRFMPHMAREVVEAGVEMCPQCDDFLSPHRGAQAVARKSRHSLRAVVATLVDLSNGTSYAQASADLRKRTHAAIEHRKIHHYWLDEVGAEGTLDLPASATNSSSAAARRGRNGWRLAADLTEQYSPLLWEHTNKRLTAREAALRSANDAILTGNPDAVLANPLCWVLDELPVVVHRKKSDATRYEQTRWHMLVVSEVRWEHRPSDTPFDLPPMREPVLRMVRAYPGASEEAWRLVLDELGVRPDFIISDFSAAIRNAIAATYPQGNVGHVPSFFHMARNIRTKLLEKPGTFYTSDGRKNVVEDLEKYLDALTRSDLVLNGATGWSDWWDGFLATLTDMKVPLPSFAAQRRLYEQPVAEAFALLSANPHLPASNAAVESKIRMKLAPLLVNRKHRFRNIARVNQLLDLVVCREQGLFLDTDAVAQLIRISNDNADGWAPKGRQICDIHPPKSASNQPGAPYSSLLDPYLTKALFEQRQVDK